MIDSETKVLGIFGDPIGHTLSPIIQNAAIKELGLKMVYVPFHVTPGNLKDAVASIKALGMPGVNITIPHKERVMEFLDATTDEARKIGAVNTIVNRDGHLTGHNTDGAGYITSLKAETGFECSGKNIVILGAGGAARGIMAAILAEAPASVTLVNRTVDRADSLAEDLGSECAEVKIHTVPLEKGPLQPRIEAADLLINSTSVGMGGKVPFNPLVLSLDKLPSEAIVSDIVYKPLNTALLRSAKMTGHTVHKGLGMLIHQGALGFELWTGEKAPVETMRKAALKALDITE